MADRFVLDNSVAMAWCFEDESDAVSDAVLDAFSAMEAVVPAIWPLEVGNVLLVAERHKRLSRADSMRFLNLLQRLPIFVEQESPERMLQDVLGLAREQRLSTYDASYLDLAMRSGIPLATRDATLLRAAKRCKVPIHGEN